MLHHQLQFMQIHRPALIPIDKCNEFFAVFYICHNPQPSQRFAQLFSRHIAVLVSIQCGEQIFHWRQFYPKQSTSICHGFFNRSYKSRHEHSKSTSIVHLFSQLIFWIDMNGLIEFVLNRVHGFFVSNFTVDDAQYFSRITGGSCGPKHLNNHIGF